jgi:hypothetical protein
MTVLQALLATIVSALYSGCEVHLEGVSEGALRVLELWRAEAEARVLILLQVLQLQHVE